MVVRVYGAIFRLFFFIFWMFSDKDARRAPYISHKQVYVVLLKLGHFSKTISWVLKTHFLFFFQFSRQLLPKTMGVFKSAK